MKLAITSHWGTLRIFFLRSMVREIMQKTRLMKIADCPRITIVPVRNGNRIILSPSLLVLLLNSIYPSIIKARKLILQIKVILENNFIHKNISWRRRASDQIKNKNIFWSHHFLNQPHRSSVNRFSPLALVQKKSAQKLLQ